MSEQEHISAIDEHHYMVITSLESMLKYAENYYNFGEYKATQSIYTLVLENEENATALVNMGYMYANGLGCEVDIDKAITYYDRAIKLDCSRAYSNKLALLLRTGMTGRADCISEALEKDVSLVRNFLRSGYSEEMSLSEEKYMNFFEEGNTEEIEAFLDKYFYEKEYVEMLNLTSYPTEDAGNLYEYLGTTDWYNESSSGTIYLFNHYVRRCQHIDELHEMFMYQMLLE